MSLVGILKGVELSSLTDLANTLMNIPGKTAASLTKFTKDANIIGRVYIEDCIAKDDIAPPLMGMLNQMYVSYILTALHLDQRVASGKTVREVIGIVASEGYSDAAKLIEDCFGTNKLDTVLPSMEAGFTKVEDDSQRLVCGRLIELDMHGVYSVHNKDTTIGSRSGETSVRGNDTGSSSTRTVSSAPDGVDLTQSDSSSRTDRTSVTVSSDNSESERKGESQQLFTFKAYLYVQLIPYIIDTDTMSNFFDFNFVPGFLRRWRQLRTGEIKFFRDFIFAKDLIEKQKAAIKKDKSGILVNMLTRQRSALVKWLLQLTGLRPENHNAASAMSIISKQTFTKACSKAHVDFNSSSAREKFFAKTFTMITVVVDQMYGTVDMYINGINMRGNYTFDMINKVGAKGRDSFDLKQIMQALNQGMTPKF